MRFILLGASNVTLAFPRLWHGLRRACSEPLEMFAAHGHGRSFGTWSRIGPRELPGIVPCRLWNDLAAQPPSAEPPRALITDIGNDLLYGVDPDQIAEWVATCLERLTAMSARVVLTQLPLASALGLGRARFRFFRSMFFPASTVQFGDLATMVTRLNQHILDLGREHHIPTLDLRGQWYGFDPIHIRRRHRNPAWQELLASWFDDSTVADFRAASPTQSLRQWRQRPSERRWFGREQNAIQPALREADGSTLWLY
ncbi:MAG: hypothetical protein DWI21_06430 [Planctomycetota bacterium]|nr:MAG: hypothetical protein DWI21_06430 [Planctomycetota bacterium]